MASLERQKKILGLLRDLRGADSLKLLFSELNYNYVNKPLSKRQLSEGSQAQIAGEPTLLVTAGADDDFGVIYVRLDSDGLLRTVERPIIQKLLQNHPYSLFVFSNNSEDLWHLVNVKYDPKATRRKLFRRITVGENERLRTASERVAMLDVEEMSPTLYGLSPLDIQAAHDQAFNVEIVTKQFFNEYKAIYGILQADLALQTGDKRWAHDYALQFLNRCMFLYFIQRKGWLGGDAEFLSSFWRTYENSNESSDSFFKSWLQVLFFEAFNNQKSLLNSAQRKYLPAELRQALWHAPYLNGGLFNPNNLDNISRDFNITDARFEQLFTFLERYNFTIAEDSPLDQEVAVDPEMIGKVYESLVNLSTEADERGDAGIFYTPRTEIDLMCRLSLVDRLTNVVGTQHKNLIYEVVFALEPQEKESVDAEVDKLGLWKTVDDQLRTLTVVDPACGSGSFLVGMLHVLDDLQCRSAKYLGAEESPYERKKRIIGHSLYGADVMDWAAHVAELRMWLALIIDANFSRDELWQRKTPLLPHFTFKIRCGDSLVQEIGGLHLGKLRELRGRGASGLKARISALKHEKIKFYNNDATRKFKIDKDLEQEELNVFRDLLEAYAHGIQTEIHQLQKQIEKPRAEQPDIFTGTVKRDAHQLDWQDVDRRKRIEALQDALEPVLAARAKLRTIRDVPFVWEIAFVEVFSDDRKGFDIVIGNPPYVRHENIADPRLPREKVTVENKRAYKAKLQRAVYEEFPRFFDYNVSRGGARHKLDAKSDLYIYFYFLTLRLLNQDGSFCFITSNSWLDVGYGADLQEFLLKRCHVKLVIDNSAKRSFESADVNTVITLLSAPAEKSVKDETNPRLDRTARFVMFKTGFENALSPVLFEEIEEAGERRATPEFRVFPIQQRKLFDEGLERVAASPASMNDTVPVASKKKAALVKAANYVGNKWGGKYLRAPEIYWKILEKAHGKLIRLGDITEVRFGIKTGANEFFFLDKGRAKELGIEKQFLAPAIQNLRECKSLAVHPELLKSFLFLCPKSKKELKGTKALKYIEWGESQKFHSRPSCASRPEWWNLGTRRPPDLSFSYMIDSTAKTLYVNKHSYQSNNFHDIFMSGPGALRLCASLNSTLFQLMVNVSGRANFGGGLMKMETYELADSLCMNPAAFEFADRTLLIHTDWDVVTPSRERRQLDAIIFDALDLTAKEREEVYEAVIGLVKNRLVKASSFRSSERMSYHESSTENESRATGKIAALSATEPLRFMEE